MKGRALIWALLAAWCFAAPDARAMESAAVVSKRATATLVSESDSVGTDGKIRLALRLRQAPGWHTYWRNPGDAGVAATLAFGLPAGATASDIAWPTPQRTAEGPITTFAYEGEVLLPVTVTAAAGRPLPVTLQANWLICADICVPEEGQFRLDLPPGTGAPSAQAPLFAAAIEHTPRPSPWTAVLDPSGTLHLSGADLSPATVREAWFAPYDPARLDASSPQSLRAAPGTLALSLKTMGQGPLAGVLVLRDAADRKSAFELVAEPGAAPILPVTPSASVLGVLAAALLGGLLLNVMPCVFPVLAMKAAGLAGLGGADRRRARWLAVSYLAGTTGTFCAAGFLLVALREAGGLIGWGFQFQNPAFVAGSAFLLFLMGLNLSGLFAIEIPGAAGAGQGVAGRAGHVGSFFTGALAVLVATPCTAPFMGAAITAALASPGGLAIGVFACLGVGLALPYVVLAWIPGMTRALPRPGRWMDLLRQVLAFPLFLTVAWLAWVLAQQSGPDGVLLLAVGCTALGFGGWLLGLAQRNGRKILFGVACVVGLLAFASVATLQSQPAKPGLDAFSVGRLEALRAEGRPVFVDMSAAWCVTCLVNERVALAPVREAFARRGVVLLRGDWTSRDPEITRFLREHGSDGVPLYVFYPGDGRPAVVLPQILTPGIVLDAVSA